MSRLQQAPWCAPSAPVAACPPERIGALPPALERSTSLLSVKTALSLTYGNSALRQAGGIRSASRARTPRRRPAQHPGPLRHKGHRRPRPSELAAADAPPSTPSRSGGRCVVPGGAEGGVRRGEVACSAVSGKFVGRTLHARLLHEYTSASATVPQPGPQATGTSGHCLCHLLGTAEELGEAVQAPE